MALPRLVVLFHVRYPLRNLVPNPCYAWLFEGGVLDFYHWQDNGVPGLNDDHTARTRRVRSSITWKSKAGDSEVREILTPDLFCITVGSTARVNKVPIVVPVEVCADV